MNPLIASLSEADFQQMIVDRARAQGWLVHHDRRQDLGIGGDPGFPDLVLARNKAVHFVEVKTEQGRMTQEQNRWRGHLTVEIWRPSTWPTIQQILDKETP